MTEPVQKVKSNSFSALAIIGVCVIIGAVCGVALMSGVGQDGKKSNSSKKQELGQSVVNWLLGSDAKQKSRKQRSYNQFSKPDIPVKTDFKVSSPFSKPSTIILD
jgi:hypothetical protein